MDEHTHLRNAAEQGSIRSQALLLCALPVLLLGISLLLLFEYASPDVSPGGISPLLRLLAIALVLLFTFAALACGSHLAERTVRPIRALLHVADGFRLAVDPPSPVLEPDPDLRRLSLRIHTLVQQNRSGARAVMELEALRGDVEAVLVRLRAAGDRIPDRTVPPPPVSGVSSEAGRELREEIDRFWDHLRDDLTGMAARADRIVRFLEDATREENGNGAEARPAAPRPAAEEFAELERLATVWSLEIERARRVVSDLPGSLGDCFQAFRGSFDALRGEFAAKPLPGGEARVARAEAEALRNQVDRWLGEDPAAMTILIDASLPANPREGKEERNVEIEPGRRPS